MMVIQGQKMSSFFENNFSDTYAYEKLCEFVSNIFTDLGPARVKLSENLHFIAIINPTDFKNQKHQELWKQLQKRLLGKTKNIGLIRAPKDRLTVQNMTLKFALNTIWSVYEDCCTNVL